MPTAASIPPDPAGRQTVNLTFRQDAQASLNDLVKRVREGDAAAAKAILAFGSHAVPIVIEGLENSFAEPKENRAADALTDILVKIGSASVKPSSADSARAGVPTMRWDGSAPKRPCRH